VEKVAEISSDIKRLRDVLANILPVNTTREDFKEKVQILNDLYLRLWEKQKILYEIE